MHCQGNVQISFFYSFFFFETDFVVFLCTHIRAQCYYDCLILVIYASGGPPISVTCWTEPNFLIEMLRTLVTDKDMLLKFFQMLNMIFLDFVTNFCIKKMLNVACSVIHVTMRIL